MSNSSSERIENWLDQVSSVPLSLAPEPSSIPTNPQSRAGIRKKRAMSSSSRGISPAKRRRGDGGDSSQRASLASVSEPKLRSTTSTASRSSSPARDIFNQLRLSTPAIICEPQATGFLPEAVLSLRKRLTVGFGQGVIPEGLKVLLKINLAIMSKLLTLSRFSHEYWRLIPQAWMRYLSLHSLILMYPSLHWVPYGMRLRGYVLRQEIVICMERMKMLGAWMLFSLFFLQDCEGHLNCT